MSELDAVLQPVWELKLKRDPFLTGRLGRPVEALSGWNLEILEEDAAFARRMIGQLDAIGTSHLDEQEALTASFIRWGLELATEAPQNYWYDFPVTPYNGGMRFMHLAQLVFATFTFEDKGDLDRYKSLVADFGRLVRDVAEKLRGQLERGIVLPRAAIPGARATVSQIRDSAPSLLVPTADRLKNLDATGGFVDDVARLVSTEVVTRFDEVLAEIGEDYEQKAPEGVGVAQYDGGIDFYRYSVRLRNSVSMEPDEIHQIGLAAVEALAEAMAEARGKMGFTGSEAGFKDSLREEPRLYASTPQEVEERYLGYMERLEPKIAELFSVLPKAPYGVERLDPQLEPGMTYGFYEPPTPEKPVGRYRFNASQLDKRSLLNAAAIIYHELAPGHHFHIARQAENESLPDIRRHTFEIGAYNEGWAEYAAGLGWELGLYDDPLDAYGKLAHERFIAQRLVVDTGMNVFGWSLDKARAYMAEHTFESDVQIETETLRYSTDLPAQALGYHLGHRAMLACRERAESTLGAAFDVRDFHEALLGSGSLPLPVLDEHVDRFIAGR